MATWLAVAGFLAIIGLPIYLMWGVPSIFRGFHHDSESAVVPQDGPSSDPSPSFSDSGGGDSGGGGGDP